MRPGLGEANIVILSDRGVDENHVAIPSLLAVSALEQHLIRTKKRTAVSVILESAEPREVHHFAALLGYGARAVKPYLAQECIEELIQKGILDKDAHAAIQAYDSALLHGIVKIASRWAFPPSSPTSPPKSSRRWASARRSSASTSPTR